ncbi:MAG: hypothetical protein RSE18_00490 [Acinetobacter sp.]
MKVIIGMQNVAKGVFLSNLEKTRIQETRKERQLRIKKERRKQLIDSLNSVGYGYHEQQGWFK